jgi:lysyl-tRNA synthetase class 2
MVGDWRPACSIQNLRQRARMLEKTRRFFADRNVLEVETPVLCKGIGTDPNLEFFSTRYLNGQQSTNYFMQTSPEFCMKRLLAAGSGSIYQICKAFRNGESGRFHNPEFTLLEWYRVGFDLAQLMDEVSDLIKVLFDDTLIEVEKISYRDIFYRHTSLDPLVFDLESWSQCARRFQLADADEICADNHALWLDFLFSFLVQPQLGRQSICQVYDYPACQSSLAEVNRKDPRIVDRVEVFFRGIELGNGYFELTDVEEQQNRFEKEREIRRQRGIKVPDLDRRFLAAVKSGLPRCSGMAIGLDRLLMLMTGSAGINEVLSFPVDLA